MATIKLPRYVTPKRLSGGRIAYYFTPPIWARPPHERNGILCPIHAAPLGEDVGEAIRRGEIMGEALDAWRTGSVGEKSVHGTVAWLFAWYREQDRFTDKSAKTRKDYAAIMGRIALEPMKVGTLGQRRASAVNAAAADTIYKRWKVKHGRRQASYAMQVCRLVWNWAKRHHDVTGVTANPFAGMGLSTKADKGNYAATRAEFDLYRATAHEMGLKSMAVAAALGFDLCQRVWDVFGFVDPDGVKARGFCWSDYRPGDSIRFTQSKTGKAMEIPLHDVIDGQGVSLFPALVEELDAAPRAAIQIVVDGRTGLPFTYDQMNDRHRAICAKAGLPRELTFTSFRHGGLTELGDAGVADVRSISGHSQLQTTAIYNQATAKKAREAALVRLRHTGLLADLSERESERESEWNLKTEAKYLK